MRTFKILFPALVVSVVLASCSRSVTKPYETSVDHIFKLSTGMTLSKVSSLLDCTPHSFFFDGSSGCKIVEYRYRRKYHERDKQDKVHYRDENVLYALFYDDKLREVITSSGQENSIQLMIDEVNIRAACSYSGRTNSKERILEKYLENPTKKKKFKL